MKLSPLHYDLLESYGVNGSCYRGVWRWLHHGEPVTRQVKALIKNGYLHAQYYSGGRAAACATEKGREALKSVSA